MVTTRILVADDHAVVRAGLRYLLDAQPDLTVADEAGTGEEAVAKAISLRPDILLLDIALPDLNGLEVARRVRQQAPSVRIIVLSMYNDEAYLRQFLELGAVGYVPKEAAHTELLDAVRAVARGDAFIHPSLLKLLIDSYQRQPGTFQGQQPVSDLSARETEVLRLVALGHTSQEIAEQLCISTSTVETHRARIMEKLDLRSRAQLVRYALSRGLLEEH